MNPSHHQPGFELRETIATIRAHRILTFFTVAAVVGGIMFLSYRQPEVYRSEARILVQKLPVGLSQAVPVNLDTEVELVESRPVAVRAADLMGLDVDPTVLIRRVDVRALPDTEVMEIGFRGPTAEQARDGANAFARSYLQYRAETALEALEAAEDLLSRQLADRQRELEEVNRDIEAARQEQNLGLASTLEAERSVLAARLALLQQQLDRIQPELVSTFGAGKVLQDAPLPAVPASPDHRRNLLLGLLFGVAAGVAVALLRERLNDHLRGRLDLQRATGAPVLALIPRFRGKPAEGEIVVLSHPDGMASEAFRTLRTGVQFLASKRRLKSILITSPGPSEGKTVTSVNLALTLAQAGRRVVLVSADLRKPAVETYFRMPREPGLAEWLQSRDPEPWKFVHDPGIPNLRVIPSGNIPSNPAELLASSRLGKLIALLEDQCDALVFDSPPVLAVADASILSSHVDGTILVAHESNTLRSAAVHARDELERVGANLVGSVLNAFKPHSGRYGRYYGYYGEAAEDGRKSGKHSRPGDELPRYVAGA